MFQKGKMTPDRSLFSRTGTLLFTVGFFYILGAFPNAIFGQEVENPLCVDLERELRLGFSDIRFSRNDIFKNDCQMGIHLENSRDLTIAAYRFRDNQSARKSFIRDYKTIVPGRERKAGGRFGPYPKGEFWSDAMALRDESDDSVIFLRVDNYVLVLISFDWNFLTETERVLRQTALYQ